MNCFILYFLCCTKAYTIFLHIQFVKRKENMTVIY